MKPATSSNTPTPRLKTWLLRGGIIALVAAVGGFLVAASGIVPIKASSGHWAITAWFLNFSMERSVDTHTLGMDAPPLDDPALILKGATHYDLGCSACHGHPSLKQPRIAARMTPHPPYLPDVIHNWDAPELFYVVKHGVKFTGMPAWPAQHRDDEVWAVTAFLQRFPEMSADEYRRLARGEAVNEETLPVEAALVKPENVPEAIRNNCIRCHGEDGLGRGSSAFPILAGQTKEYLAASLKAYAVGARASGIMAPIAAGLSESDLAELGRYYSELDTPQLPLATPIDPEAVKRGEEIARNGVPRQRLPACAECHGPTDSPRDPRFPTLAGQYQEYIALQLELFKKGHRGGTDYAHLMDPVAQSITPEQIRDVAAYYASLPAQSADQSEPKE